MLMDGDKSFTISGPFSLSSKISNLNYSIYEVSSNCKLQPFCQTGKLYWLLLQCFVFLFSGELFVGHFFIYIDTNIIKDFFFFSKNPGFWFLLFDSYSPHLILLGLFFIPFEGTNIWALVWGYLPLERQGKYTCKEFLKMAYVPPELWAKCYSNYR